MSENFSFNAPQFVDFCELFIQEDLQHAEAYFDVDHEKEIERPLEKCLQTGLRRSMSTGNILTAPVTVEENKEDCLNEPMSNLNIEKDNTTEIRERKRTSYVANTKRSRSASREKFSQQKPETKSGSYRSVAERVLNFEKGFRAEQMFKPFHIHSTIPQSPALKTKQRARPSEMVSKEDKELENAKKYKIKAKPVNTKILYGPVKPQMPVERKASTVVEPFKITSAKPMVTPPPEVTDTFKFHAKSVPKAMYNPPKIPPRSTTPTLAKQSKPLQPLRKQRSLDNLVRINLNNTQLKPTKNQQIPLSFEERNKQLKEKKEEFINKVLEEEKKAREFHARPPPKYLLHAAQLRDTTLQSETNSKNVATENTQLNSTAFKARPATVLYKKPFEPKTESKPLTEITEFQLNTDKRAKERESFVEYLKRKEERLEQLRKEQEEKVLAEEQKQIALLRKQAEHKANPIRHYKEVMIKKSNILTVPMSPKFLTAERLKNKENARQKM